MNRNQKITIPEPCHENWDKMTPKDNGRFCLSCSKTVVDFTTMLSDEVQHFFIQNQNKSICGRFKNSQLETITIQIPSQVLYSQTHYHKMFLLALFIAMGTTLFSCQDKNGIKQKIDKVEVVKENLLEKNITKGKTLRGENEIPPPPPPPPPKVDQVKFVKPDTRIKNVKAINPKSINCEKTTSKTETDSTTYYETGILVLASDNTKYSADYPGGQKKLYTVFKRNFIIPEKASELEGELELAFNINKLGKIDNIKVLKDFDSEISEEGIRVLGTLARWMPATLNGKAINSSYNLKIIFSRDADLNGIKKIESKSQIASIKLTPELE